LALAAPGIRESGKPNIPFGRQTWKGKGQKVGCQ
jgi:hypothetical protein